MRVTINENDCGCATCGNIGNSDICAECSWDSKWEPKPVTNADRIRAMPDEELAWELIFYRDDWGDYETPCGCIEDRDEAYRKTVDWLKQPAKERR